MTAVMSPDNPYLTPKIERDLRHKVVIDLEDQTLSSVITRITELSPGLIFFVEASKMVMYVADEEGEVAEYLQELAKIPHTTITRIYEWYVE